MNGNNKAANEKQKLIQEKCLAILNNMLKDEDNKYCVDCDAKGPRWASWNLGVFLCIRCAGIHRNLGVHISKVKSVNLDTWKPEQAVMLQQMGNSRARAVYEANLPDNFRRPQTDATLESFIRAKYEHNKYTAREWVPPRVPKVNWDAEIEAAMRDSKSKKSGGAARGRVEKPAPLLGKPLPAPAGSPAPLAVPAPGAPAAAKETAPPPAAAAPAQPASAAADLLGLETPSPAPGSAAAASDPFGDFLAAAPVSEPTASPAAPAAAGSGGDALKSEEADFFSQPAPGSGSGSGSAAGSSVMSRDSIMALYGQAPTPSPAPTGGGGLSGFGGMPAVSAVGGFPAQQTQQPAAGFPAAQGFTMGFPAAQQMQPQQFPQQQMQQFAASQPQQFGVSQPQQFAAQQPQFQSQAGAFQSVPYQQPYMAGGGFGQGFAGGAPTSLPQQGYSSPVPASLPQQGFPAQLQQQMAGMSLGGQQMSMPGSGAGQSSFPPMGSGPMSAPMSGPLWQ